MECAAAAALDGIDLVIVATGLLHGAEGRALEKSWRDLTADNRLGGWYSYRASKAALNQMVKTLSIELARGRSEAICIGLHPGTVDTKLSRPFQSNVAPEKLFEAGLAARQLLSVINGLTPKDTGGVFAWDGQRIPY